MATRTMTHSLPGGRFHFTETATAGGATDPLLLPAIYPHDPGHKPASVFVKPAGGGSARIEFTLSTQAQVEAATAVWISWPHGDVTAAASASINGPITALRCVSVSGAADWGVMI